ncbi:MAG: Stp1/IreP family PP2C-type Ser/Thr phosphatase [Selenomonadaceae bacterium]|nr:Stp1/IreP family PP2C-type Ser/Thr phosphatase [Selenomonadaceae bacterium]
MAKVFQATHVGKIRRNNEDSLTVIEPQTFVVADGMGGAQAGEVASQLLVEVVKIVLAEIPAPWDEKILSRAILAANEKILSTARQNSEYRGMGTTATILSLNGAQGYFAHVGDSRLYLLRSGTLRQLTEDHSYVETLVRRGELSAEAARTHPMKNVLTQAVGAMDDIQVDAGNFPVQGGDIFLLCTDGLTNMVDDATIAKILQNAENPADALIDAALAAGGRDNVTVIVAGVD